MVDWGELLPELVQGIADYIISPTGCGGEGYMNMRVVCSSWRSAISKPSPLAAIADLRFRPRHWVMLNLPSKYQDGDNDDACLFLHILTGRFRCLRLPVLHDHILIGASDGLLVLGDRVQSPHLACVLNPLTGDMLPFSAPVVHQRFDDIMSTAVSGGSHTTLFSWADETVVCASPTSDVIREMDVGTGMTSMVTFQGNVYYSDQDGWVFKFVTPCDEKPVLVAKVSPDKYIHFERKGSTWSELVESRGELLLVHGWEALKVFRVDIEHKLLQEVNSLGSGRALFLGDERCISVDVGNLPSVDGDCVYLFNWVETSKYMCVYNLRDDKMEVISSMYHLDRPFSLVYVLLRYCDFRRY